MNGWIKKFSDGQEEIGSDKAVNNRTASWSRGRLDSMIGLSIEHEGIVCSIYGTGQYWQSDDFEVQVFQSKPKIVKRRIQKYIDTFDNWLVITISPYQNYYEYSLYNSKPKEVIGGSVFKINKRYQTKWLTVEIDLETNQVVLDYRNNKI